LRAKLRAAQQNIALELRYSPFDRTDLSPFDRTTTLSIAEPKS
jgi:hypothetical protein